MKITSLQLRVPIGRREKRSFFPIHPKFYHQQVSSGIAFNVTRPLHRTATLLVVLRMVLPDFNVHEQVSYLSGILTALTDNSIVLNCDDTTLAITVRPASLLPSIRECSTPR